MEKKMTSGEIAKKTGVSQKAIRFYDEKGLLKPTDYSEGNYRLYDMEALAVLEKIIALKQIGLSLEEIHESLIANKDIDITEVLTRQLHLLEAKKHEIEKSIASIKSVLLRQDSETNWDTVADIIKIMQMDQGADERHNRALKHHTASEDWYVMIYKTLGLHANAKVLDLGCGYGKLWRNNQNSIPEGVVIDGYDLRGSWADDFYTYVEQNKETLTDHTIINLYFEDVEAEKTWESIAQKGTYDCIIAHYLIDFLKDTECFVAHVAKVLAPGGMFSVNDVSVSCEHIFWQDIFTKLQLRIDFLKEKESSDRKKLDAFQALLRNYFSRVETVIIKNQMRYEDAEELFTRLLERYPEAKKYLTESQKTITSYFIREIETNGEVLVPTGTDFQHCFK